MKPEAFLFSRTPQADYSYLFPLPPHRSDAVGAFLQEQLVCMQSGRPDGIVRFFLTDTDAVLLRSVDSGVRDLYSRPILSLEGIYCPAEEIRPFWLALPLIVPGFWSSPSLYGQLVQNETPVSVPLTALLDGFSSRSKTQKHLTAMRKAVFQADTPVSFTFDADGFHPSVPLSTRGRIQWHPQEQRRCQICLSFDRREKTAHLEAVSSSAPVYSILRSADIVREADGWRFSNLEAAAAAMECELDAHGWQYNSPLSAKGDDA